MKPRWESAWSCGVSPTGAPNRHHSAGGVNRHGPFTEHRGPGADPRGVQVTCFIMLTSISRNSSTFDLCLPVLRTERLDSAKFKSVHSNTQNQPNFVYHGKLQDKLCSPSLISDLLECVAKSSRFLSSSLSWDVDSAPMSENRCSYRVWPRICRACWAARPDWACKRPFSWLGYERARHW